MNQERWKHDAPRLDGPPLPTLVAEQARRAAVRDLVVAVDRMIDGWADADDAVRRQLWQQMAAATAVAAEVLGVYPL